MRIVVGQRYVKKADGKLYLQCKYESGIRIGMTNMLLLGNSRVSDREDVPICLDEWVDEDTEKVIDKDDV